MSRKLQLANLYLSRIDSRHVRLALVILSLILFVLGAGAPDGGGDLGR